MDQSHQHQRSTIDPHPGFEKQASLEAGAGEELEEEAQVTDGFTGEEEASTMGDMEDDMVHACVDHHQEQQEGADHQEHEHPEQQEEEHHHEQQDPEHEQEHEHDHEHGEEQHAIGQLSITYQGQLYHFDDVSAEKVQDVLNILGGQEISVCSTFVNMVPYPVKEEGMFQSHDPVTSTRLNPREREEVIRKYREKRERRVWDKRIMYAVRSTVARRMIRNKGQFAKVKDEDTGEEKPAVEVPQEFVCHHCGSRATPMTRKGPDGPRTLCNACGLMWSNKGVLRPLKPGQTQQDPKVYSPTSRGTKRKLTTTTP